jgi:hypothetical protein
MFLLILDGKAHTDSYTGIYCFREWNNPATPFSHRSLLTVPPNPRIWIGSSFSRAVRSLQLSATLKKIPEEPGTISGVPDD